MNWGNKSSNNCQKTKRNSGKIFRMINIVVAINLDRKSGSNFCKKKTEKIQEINYNHQFCENKEPEQKIC